MEEDKLYAYEPFYRNNIRRGNTFLRINYPDNTTAIYLIRKGMQKFFDLAIEYVHFNLGLLKDFGEKFGIKDQDEHYILRDVIFMDAEEALTNNKKVLVRGKKIK